MSISLPRERIRITATLKTSKTRLRHPLSFNHRGPPVLCQPRPFLRDTEPGFGVVTESVHKPFFQKQTLATTKKTPTCRHNRERDTRYVTAECSPDNPSPPKKKGFVEFLIPGSVRSVPYKVHAPAPQVPSAEGSTNSLPWNHDY